MKHKQMRQRLLKFIPFHSMPNYEVVQLRRRCTVGSLNLLFVTSLDWGFTVSFEDSDAVACGIDFLVPCYPN